MMMPANPEVRLTLDSLDELATRYQTGNPKRHHLDAIHNSTERFGFIGVVVINDGNGRILEGHGRVETLHRDKQQGNPPPEGIIVTGSGDWLVPTIHGYNLSEPEARAYLVAANRTAELGGWDDARLAAILAEVRGSARGLDGIGYDVADLDRILASLKDAEATPGEAPEREPDRIPETPRPQRANPGDTWELGDHLLACGDARDPDLLAMLVGDGKVELLITDPPYGVDYTGKTEQRLTIANDGRVGLDALLTTAFMAVDTVLAPGARFYISHPAGPNAATFMQAIDAAGWGFRQGLVWVKDSAVLGHGDYHYRHEPIAYGVRPGNGRTGRGSRGWYGGNDAVSVFEVPRPKSSRDHPTAKPVALIEIFLKNSSQRGDLVLDPFLGSGTTLIAAERLGRRGIGVELDPVYATVAITRWEEYTGCTATLRSRTVLP